MTLADVSPLSIYDRQHHYYKSHGVLEMPISEFRLRCQAHAEQCARDEMLNEIHVMLCHLCGIKDDKEEPSE